MQILRSSNFDHSKVMFIYTWIDILDIQVLFLRKKKKKTCHRLFSQQPQNSIALSSFWNVQLYL